MEYLDIHMKRGDTPVVRGFLRDENNNLVNDATASYKLAARVTRDATAEVFSVTTLQFAAGEGRCPIPTSATSAFTYDRVLYYDMQVTETGGNVTTLLQGKLFVYQDAAR
jgi:hypothetical protein